MSGFVALPEAVWICVCRFLLPHDPSTPPQAVRVQQPDVCALARASRGLYSRLRHDLGFMVPRVTPVAIAYADLLLLSPSPVGGTAAGAPILGATAAAAAAAATRVHSAIGRAFGDAPDALGLVLVTGIPHYDALYRSVTGAQACALAHGVPTPFKRAHLSPVAAGGYGAGWTCGRDSRKQNFRANPLCDAPADAQAAADAKADAKADATAAGDTTSSTAEAVTARAVALARDCSDWYSPNRWPPEPLLRARRAPTARVISPLRSLPP